MSTVTPQAGSVLLNTPSAVRTTATVTAAIQHTLALPQAWCWVPRPWGQFLGAGLITPFELPRQRGLRQAEQLPQGHTDSRSDGHTEESWLLPGSAGTHPSVPCGFASCPRDPGTGTRRVLGTEAFPPTALTHRPSKPLSWACSTPHRGGQTKLPVLGLFSYFQMDLFAGSVPGLPSLRGGQGPSARLILGGSRKSRQPEAAPHRVLGCSTAAAAQDYSWAFKGAWPPQRAARKKE